MCGIAGILDYSEQQSDLISGKTLRKMLDALRHRGPDDRGEEKLGPGQSTRLYLGHQRLSIIDLTMGGHQPMANDDQTVWISTNSEIYNYRELRDQLRGKYDFRSESDTEVLLRAYEEWGADCLLRLRGMFAFAIWDARKNLLFLARDRLGIKPLYFYRDQNVFLFASEVRAVLASGIPERTIDPTGLYHYLSFGHVGRPQSVVRSIYELRPGCYMLIKGKSVEEKQYWNPLRSADTLPSTHPPFESGIQPLLEESVRLRMVSDVPLGAFLSGGIDSSAVVSLMTQFTEIPVRTLSVVFREKEYDESDYSRQIAELLGTDHRVLPSGEAELLELLPQALGSMDQPTVDGINVWLISRAARESGLTVALSGLGGDELFGGYPSFHSVPRLFDLSQGMKWVPLPIRKLAGLMASKLLPGSDRNTKLAHLLSNQLSGNHPYFLFRALFPEEVVRRLLQNSDLASLERDRQYRKSRELLEYLKPLDPINLISYLELDHYMGGMLLRDTDMMSMAHGLEVRIPLIDHKLVEWMFSIPGKAKRDTHSPKPLLVRSLPRRLPDKIVQRKKMGFTLPFEFWLRGKLKTEVESVLRTPVDPLKGLISDTECNKVWQDFLQGRVSWSRPWALYTLKHWVQRNLAQ